MTLREKFENIEIIFENQIGILKYDTALFSIQCEKIADEFAIGFVEWRLTTFVKNADEYTMQELLEIYKKERKL